MFFSHVDGLTFFMYSLLLQKFEDAQGQAICNNGLKKKGSLIYKTLHRKLSFLPQPDDIEKINNLPSNFYYKFLVENYRAGLMIFLHLSGKFILFL